MTAYAVVNASSDCLVARGICGGSHQSSDFGELRAISVALEWAIPHHGAITLWSDSAFATQGLERLLRDLHDIPDDAYSSEWCRIQHALSFAGARIYAQHVSAHQVSLHLWSSAGDWAAYWNNRADHEVQCAHQLWPARLHHQWTLLRGHHEQALRRLLRLQDLHLATLRSRTEILKTYEVPPDEQEEEVQEPPQDESIAARQCHADWQGFCERPAWGSGNGPVWPWILQSDVWAAIRSSSGGGCYLSSDHLFGTGGTMGARSSTRPSTPASFDEEHLDRYRLLHAFDACGSGSLNAPFLCRTVCDGSS